MAAAATIPKAVMSVVFVLSVCGKGFKAVKGGVDGGHPAFGSKPSNFYPAWMPIFVEKILKPRKDKSYQADMKIVEAKKQELLPTLDLLNTHLADNTFLGGDCFTVADITFMPYIALFGAAGLADVFESRPNLARWKEEILSRDSWKYAAENKARRLASPSLPLVVGAPAGTVPPLTRYIAYCILLTLSGGQVAEKFI